MDMDIDIDIDIDISGEEEDEDVPEIKAAPKDSLTGPKPTLSGKKYITKHMRRYPELYRSDVSINPSYTRLKNLPYHVVCRQRVQRLRKQMIQQINREIMHIAMMQMFAIDSVRIDRLFSVGMSPKQLIVPDFATDKERRRIHDLLRSQ